MSLSDTSLDSQLPTEVLISAALREVDFVLISAPDNASGGTLACAISQRAQQASGNIFPRRWLSSPEDVLIWLRGHRYRAEIYQL